MVGEVGGDGFVGHAVGGGDEFDVGGGDKVGQSGGAQDAGLDAETVQIRGRSTARTPPVVSGALCGDLDLDLGRAATVGEARIPAAEAAGQVVVEDSGADPEEELGSGR
ncbi:MAG: hypothetical protein JO115_01465 [Pseudonocardiales bacterium]|nr:hypothetical protein [Pseudonocardiales bacterium]